MGQCDAPVLEYETGLNLCRGQLHARLLQVAQMFERRGTDQKVAVQIVHIYPVWPIGQPVANFYMPNGFE